MRENPPPLLPNFEARKGLLSLRLGYKALDIIFLIFFPLFNC